MNIFVVQDLIQYLNDIFSNIHYSLTSPNSFKRDAFNYYSSGHCASFARILKAIFLNEAQLYVSSSHVLVRIDNCYFDVCGLVLDINISDYRLAELDDYYINNILSNKDELEQKLENILIHFGKIKLHDLKKIYVETLNH